MKLPFVKYQGTGNDFVLIDNRQGAWEAFLHTKVPAAFATEKELVAHICHRYFGVGADGLMLLQDKEGYGFEMVYFNSDGGLSSMCGNGGRCIASFAFSLGLGDAIVQETTKSGDYINGNANPFNATKTITFWAPDGAHQAWALNEGTGQNETVQQIALSMNPVSSIENLGNQCWELNTGSPHYIQFESGNLLDFDLIPWARAIRYNENYAPKGGINTNIVKVEGEGKIAMRTYERGVENETLSCGTGVTAAAIAYVNSLDNQNNPTSHHQVQVSTAGGELHVRFAAQNGRFENIYLMGAATFVFEGRL